MQNVWRKIISIGALLCVCATGFAADDVVPDKTQLVTQQITLLKNRLDEAQNELSILKKQMQAPLMTEQVDKRLVNQILLDIAVARSNIDSVNIELSESQTAVNRLQKEIQDIQNQLNVYNVFGVKVTRDGAPDIDRLQTTMSYLKDILQLDQARVSYLDKLHSIDEDILHLHQDKLSRVDAWLKSQTILQLRERQAKSEFGLQQQQSEWLQRLNSLNAQLDELQQHKNYDRNVYDELQNEIFSVNEKINFTYQQMLITRYQEQMQQLRISVAHSNSINLLNQATEQAQELSKQLIQMDTLLHSRLEILTRRKSFFIGSGQNPQVHEAEYNEMTQQYQNAINIVEELSKNLLTFRTTLDKSLQRELSARQGLPGFGAQGWVDLGGELLLVPSLTFQVGKNLSYEMLKSFANMTTWDWALFGVIFAAWWGLYVVLNYIFKRIANRTPDHALGHISLKWLSLKLLQRNLFTIMLILNLFWGLAYCRVPAHAYSFLVNLAVVWLIFKSVILTSRLGLIELEHDSDGHEIVLYRKLRRIFITGGIITACTVFIYQLPVIFEIKDLFDRIFLVFLLIASVFLLRQWHIVPQLILAHIDERRTYLRRVIYLLGLVVPLVLLVNSIIGLLGFVNLIFTIAWYESVFLFVLIGYLIIRGILTDLVRFGSKLLIRHVTNGWLWTEAFLKPIDRVLRVILFLSAWLVLFIWYGWDQQSPIVERLRKLMSYNLMEVLNTTITPRSIIALVVTIAFFYWAGKWTREFVYRMLATRTKDLGLRNSIAILSQYATIVLGIIVCLGMLGIDYRSLTFMVTGLTLVIGWGLRDLLNNFASGFLLLLERPIKVGDIVSISGHEGEVTHIGGRAVTIQTWDHMEVLVPNAEIYTKTFLNWTAKDNVVRSVISIKVNRHDNPPDVQAVIHNVLAQHKDILTDPAPEVFLKELADGLNEFEVRYFINIRQVKSRIGLRSEILLAIWDAFERHGIQPPTPQHEIVVKSGDLSPLSSKSLSD